jgi:hypothetical protein
MLDTSHAFDQFTDAGTSVAQIVQAIREKIEGSAQPLKTALAVIEDIIGAVPHPVTDVREARVMAQRLAVKCHELDHHIIDVHGVAEEAAAYAKQYVADPTKQWMWVSEDAVAVIEGKTHVEGVTVQVATNAEGKIKKGGKQVLVLELYKKHVLETTPPMTNQEFIQVVMKDLQMSKAGATTYAWTARKELGEPEGGIVKAKKGRKAKAA